MSTVSTNLNNANNMGNIGSFRKSDLTANVATLPLQAQTQSNMLYNNYVNNVTHQISNMNNNNMNNNNANFIKQVDMVTVDKAFRMAVDIDTGMMFFYLFNSCSFYVWNRILEVHCLH
jgi:hypothetical protein